MQHVTAVVLKPLILELWASECSFQYLGFFTYEIWAEFKKSRGNTADGQFQLPRFARPKSEVCLENVNTAMWLTDWSDL